MKPKPESGMGVEYGKHDDISWERCFSEDKQNTIIFTCLSIYLHNHSIFSWPYAIVKNTYSIIDKGLSIFIYIILDYPSGVHTGEPIIMFFSE